MIPSYSDCQKLALARHAETEHIHCLVELSGFPHIRIMRETDLLVGGQRLIDAMLWSTDFAPDHGIDPALLA